MVFGGDLNFCNLGLREGLVEVVSDGAGRVVNGDTISGDEEGSVVLSGDIRGLNGAGGSLKGLAGS